MTVSRHTLCREIIHPAAMRALLVERCAERRGSVQVDLVERWPEIRSLPCPIVLGSNSWWIERQRRRIMYRPGCVQVEPGIYETPGAIARIYLEEAYGVARKGYQYRMTTEQWRIIEQWPAMPSYSYVTRFDHGYYIDIKAAWFQILLVAGWNIDYRPGAERPRWIMWGRPPADFPFPDAKVARSALVSLSRPARLRMWRCPDCDGIADARCTVEGTPHYRSGSHIEAIRSRYYNPMLWRFVSDVLNSVARSAVDDCGAVYVNNDGFIAPNEDSAMQIMELLARWGLDARIKAEGEGHVNARGAYQVGKAKSRAFAYPHDLDAINAPPWSDWLAHRYARMAERRRTELGPHLWRWLVWS